MGDVQSRAVHDAVAESSRGPKSGASGAPAGTGNGGSALLRPAPLGERHRPTDHQRVPGGGETPENVQGRPASIRIEKRLLSDPAGPDRPEQSGRAGSTEPEHGVVARAGA